MTIDPVSTMMPSSQTVDVQLERKNVRDLTKNDNLKSNLSTKSK